MFSALRHRTAALALGVCFILPVYASSPKLGDFANTQRDILPLSFRDE